MFFSTSCLTANLAELKHGIWRPADGFCSIASLICQPLSFANPELRKSLSRISNLSTMSLLKYTGAQKQKICSKLPFILS